MDDTEYVESEYEYIPCFDAIIFYISKKYPRSLASQKLSTLRHSHYSITKLNTIEEVIASPIVLRGTVTAIMIVDHGLVAATKSQYCSNISRLAEWLKERYPENVTETTEVILPLSEAILLEYIGEITFHRTKKNADGSDMFVSNSTINSFR